MATSKKRYVCLLVAQQLKAYCCVSVLGFLYETSLFEYLEYSRIFKERDISYQKL